jgi:guanylate kinase
MFDTQGEKDGIQYHFVTAEEMSEGIRNGDFIESAFFAGNTYGTR